MFNQNMTQRGTHATGLSVMIGRYSPDSQHRRPDRHPANIGCSFFFQIREWRFKAPHQSEMKNTKHGLRKTTNLHYTAISGATLHKQDIGKEWYRSGKNALISDNKLKTYQPSQHNNKEMLVFWSWNTRNTTEKNNEQDSYTISDTPSIKKQKQSHQNEPPTSENRNTTQANNTEKILTREQKVNLENLKRIMNGEKTTLPSLRHRMENS